MKPPSVGNTDPAHRSLTPGDESRRFYETGITNLSFEM
jgi:hypothetical protein